MLDGYGNPATEPKTKLCSTCGEAIPISARKCGKCQSYQDWRQWLSFSSTSLALCTSALAVVATSAPLVKDALRKDRSDIALRFQGVEGGRVAFLASNTGTKPGGIGLAYLEVTAKKAAGEQIMPEDIAIFRLEISKESSSLVPEGKSQQILFQVMAPVRDPRPMFRSTRVDERIICTIPVKTIQFGGKNDEAVYEVPCSEFYDIFKPFRS